MDSASGRCGYLCSDVALSGPGWTAPPFADVSKPCSVANKPAAARLETPTYA